jgi:acetolactate synthase-1/2/3 large subunit
MVRQWQEFFYEKRYAATPILSPDLVKLAEAYGLEGYRIASRKDVIPTVQAVRKSGQPCIIDFRVEQEEAVYPMVPAGADLHAMIRRPKAVEAAAAQEEVKA